MARGSVVLGAAWVAVFLVAAGCLSAGPAAIPGPLDLVGRPVVPGDYNYTKNYSQVLLPGVLDMLPVEVVKLASALDGADIPIAVWRPAVADGVKTPVIVGASPYWPADLASGAAAIRGESLRLNFVPHGYAYAALPVRGTSDAGGCMDLMGPKERADLDQAITWLGEQPWSNGKVAMIGGSYDGSTPFEVASMGNPHLATIVPISGLPDIYDLMFRNGTAETRGPIVLNLLYYEYFMTAGRSLEHQVDGAVCPESWTGFTASLWSGATGAKDPTGWWEARNSRPGVESRYEGSILFVQGLQDWNVDPALSIPWIDRLAQEGTPVHQWLGQWGHAAPHSACRAATPHHPDCRWDWSEHLLHWFDYWLKGDTTVALGPAVQVERQDGQWRTEERWPPADAADLTYELGAPNRLVAPGAATAGTVDLAPNPNGAMSTTVPGSPVQAPNPLAFYRDFTTGVLTGDHWISGLPLVHATVVPEGPGGTLAAWLYKRGADGTLHRIGWTAMNLAFADGTTTMKPVVPGQPIVARMQIQPMDALVRAGEEVVLRLWQYPPEDRMANAAPAPMQLQLGGGASVLRLPLIDRTDATAFEPPFPAGAD